MTRHTASAAMLRYDGDEMLEAAARKHAIQLSLLVAETALWAHPQVHARLRATNGTGAFYPLMRRRRAGEKDGAVVAGERLDSNVYAREAIIGAVGVRFAAHSYHACHIWPDTCHDRRYYSVVANLVLLPSAIAGLSDHDPAVKAALQYRAYELYDWHPAEEAAPLRPGAYPTNWLAPQPFTQAIARRVANWRTRQPAPANATP